MSGRRNGKWIAFNSFSSAAESSRSAAFPFLYISPMVTTQMNIYPITSSEGSAQPIECFITDTGNIKFKAESEDAPYGFHFTITKGDWEEIKKWIDGELDK